jgi:hypothetical protein
MIGGDQRSGGNGRRFVDDGGLDEPFDALNSCGLHHQYWTVGTIGNPPYVYYSTQRPDRVGAINMLASQIAILHDNARRHDDILRSMCKLFQDEIDHLP